jgi:hypothetical protein
MATCYVPAALQKVFAQAPGFLGAENRGTGIFHEDVGALEKRIIGEPDDDSVGGVVLVCVLAHGDRGFGELGKPQPLFSRRLL